MPRVKFSTLVSAMAGKSNGSVFANNRGGAFFRNNKSGSKLSTQKQQAGQAKFRSVARQWANLSDEQRASWNAAVSSFPTTNIFGDARTPSGYELFCKINGGLVLRDQPLKNYPPVPRPVPEITSLKWYTPADFLFQNKYCLTSFDSNGVVAPVYVSSTNVVSPATSYSLRTSCLSFRVPSDVSGLEYDGVFASATQGTILYTDYRIVRLVYTLALGFHVELSVVCPTGDYKAYHQITLDDLKAGLNLVVVWSNITDFTPVLYVNGSPVVLAGVQQNGTNSNFDLSKMEFGLNGGDTGAKVILNSFQYYNEVLNSDEQALVNGNYIFPIVFMTAQVSLNPSIALVTYGYCDDYTDFLYNDPIGPSTVFNPVQLNTHLPLPLVEVQIDGQVATGFQAEILTTRPVSSGVGLKSADKALQASVVYSASIRLGLTEALRASFGYYTEGSDFNIALRLFDMETGISFAPVEADKPPRKPRFKAGTDLSDKVRLPPKP